MAYVVPQVLVFQEFSLIPAILPGALNAHISGPNAYLLRYAEPAEKILGHLGAYDPDNDAVSRWPTRPPGAIVDATYTKVYIDNADLQFFRNMIGDGDTVVPTAANKITISNAKYGFATNGTVYPRYLALGDRDVQPGDRVYIRGVSVADSTNYELDTYVLAIEAEAIDSAVGSVQDGGSNEGTQPSTPAVITPPAVPTVTLTADLSSYSALTDGALTDHYTITVLSSSSGGDLLLATLQIKSGSGNDDVASVASGAEGDFFTVGVRGLQLKFTGAGEDLIAGQVYGVDIVSKYTKIVADDTGSTYTGTLSTTYVITITRGGKIDSANPVTCPQFSVRTAHGVDSAAPITITDATAYYPVGTQGLQIKFTNATTDGICLGDSFSIVVTGTQDGRMSTLVLGHNLPIPLYPLPIPPGEPAINLDLILYVERNIMVDALAEDGEPNWEQNPTQITIHGGIQAYDEAFTVDGEPQPLTVTSGDVYVEYRAWRSDLANQVNSISDVGTIDDAISGALTPDNPLKWGVYKALSNSNGSNVLFTAVTDPNSLDAWNAILALLTGRTDVYNLVPLTFDRNVLDLYAAHVADESAPEQASWRALFCSIQAKSQEAVVSDATSTDDNIVMALISVDPTASGDQYTLLTVPVGNSDFLTNNAQPGDIVRTDYGVDSSGTETYDEYVIDQVINENSLLLMAGPAAPVTIAQKIEIWHYLTRDEVAADLAQQAGSFASRRVKAVWPDTVGAAGVLMEGFYLAAALAGLRSGVVPQQGLTNVQISGFDDLSRTTDFFGGAQLNTMAGAGTWIVTQAPDGTVYSRHGLTTDNTDVNSSEEMVTSNLDSISYLFAQRLAPYIGVMNVTQSALLVLGTEIDATIDFLKSNGYVDRLGGQLVDATIVSLQPHAILADRVVCVIDVTLPYPMNNLELHLVV